jgi:hypothetical protein
VASTVIRSSPPGYSPVSCHESEGLIAIAVSVRMTT